MSSSRRGDTIRITDLALHLPTGAGPSAFGLRPPPPCPALVSLEITVNDKVIPSCTQDDTFGGLGINYSAVSKAIIAFVGSQNWETPEDLLRGIVSIPLELSVVTTVKAELKLPKASLIATSIIYSAHFSPDQTLGTQWNCTINGMKIRAFVGLHPYEQTKKQPLEFDIRIEGYDGSWQPRELAEKACEWIEGTSFGTIEALIDTLARLILTDHVDLLPSPSIVVTVNLRKPAALPYAIPGVSITRTIRDYPSKIASSSRAESTVTSSIGEQRADGSVTAYIAFGSNIGDSIGHIRRAVDELAETEGVRLTQTSRLYESEPMYVEDQDRFINGVLEIETGLSPMELLRTLKRIERSVGRTKTFRNGPRVVDLDLLIYGDERQLEGQVEGPEYEDGVGWLQIPHPRIAEREFVLRPLSDIAPQVEPFNRGESVTTLLSKLMASSAPSLAPIIPFPHPARPLRLDGSPKIMQIFNATPDSFSDGNQAHLVPAAAFETVKRLFDTPHPPAILDIGGMSTRPGSLPCSEEEEINRVVPLIRLIRSSDDPAIRSVPISIDTYRADVARAAVEAGASCINDVRGGAEEGMKETMAETSVPVMLMHSRGDSVSMTDPALQDYSALGGVVKGVQQELGNRVRDALDAGVKPWNIVIDPGLGFAKSRDDNLALLRHVSELSTEKTLTGLPILIGGSRKGFVGQVIKRKKEEASQRGFGDAAVVAWCAAQAAQGKSPVDILRVHDGRGMAEVLAMWKAIEG